ncbi:MAG: hypothetical protein WAM60_19325 [Candidatus Promineifilaceae bacterium]
MVHPNKPKRIFFDTNVFIIGFQIPESPESIIINWASTKNVEPEVEIIVSSALINEIRRVARRIKGKDWAGEILSRIWHNMNLRFVLVDPTEAARLEREKIIPREDIQVYLTAKEGRAECFISANRELVRVLAKEENAFQCLTAVEFIDQYLTPPSF